MISLPYAADRIDIFDGNPVAVTGRGLRGLSSVPAEVYASGEEGCPC